MGELYFLCVKAYIEHDVEGKKIFLMYNGRDAGYLTYDVSNNVLDIQHTVVYSEFRGQRFGKVLVDHAIAYASENGYSIIPTCSYAKRIVEDKD